MELNYKDIGKRIRKLREEQGLSQEKLRNKADISSTHMSHIESGTTKVSLPTLIDIANALGTTTDALLCDSLESATPVFKRDIERILEDCSVYELRVMIETMSLVKKSLRNLPRDDDSGLY